MPLMKCPICGKEDYMCSWETCCWRCKKKQKQIEISYSISSGKKDSTIQEDDVFCPYCGEVYNITENEHYDLYEAEEHEVECPSCEKTFLVNTRIEYKFSTDRKDED